MTRDKPVKSTRLPDDWEAGQVELDYLASRRPNLTSQQRRDLIDDFKDYWLAEPDPHGRKVDWTRTFMTHVRRWKHWLDTPRQANTYTSYHRPQSANDPYSEDVVL